MQLSAQFFIRDLLKESSVSAVFVLVYRLQEREIIEAGKRMPLYSCCDMSYHINKLKIIIGTCFAGNDNII